MLHKFSKTFFKAGTLITCIIGLLVILLISVAALMLEHFGFMDTIVNTINDMIKADETGEATASLQNILKVIKSIRAWLDPIMYTGFSFIGAILISGIVASVTRWKSREGDYY
ncbi:MAG: hypothetical protein ACRC4M_01315 [Mycoplasma sp.]